MMMTEYKQLDGQAWLEFGKNLLKEKGSEEQKEFLEICKTGKDGFLDYIDEQLSSYKDGVIADAPIYFERKFTETEFLCPPKDTQEIIWDMFKDMPDEIMYSCGFWGYTIIGMIKNDSIKPEYLASELNGVNKTGIYMIDEALKSTVSEDKKIDDRVRRILRSMCNPEPRGKRIVFNDFSLGKAYWRWHWATRMAQHIGLNSSQILEIFDEKYYAAFSEKMHSGQSYISSENVLGGLLLYLQSQPRKEIHSKQLKKIIDKISYLSAWKAIEMQDPARNQEEIKEISKIL